ncbi:ArsR/SmtB family transcription factor [Azospirillum tabaci]|uniref:ArsR/SmtB family transcription factor n=1 Tax=Azospirillum tabaci TaxID=2752310 RepID=UPI0016618241|nr:metalloregulator ArsR/SmtB family transcription factor [Azospirillum tabaci]
MSGYLDFAYPKSGYAAQEICSKKDILMLEYACSLFQALSDPIRLRCIIMMRLNGAMAVNDLAFLLQVPQPKVSKHLAILKNAGLACRKRDASWVKYSIAPELPVWVHVVIEQAMNGLAEVNDPVVGKDFERHMSYRLPSQKDDGNNKNDKQEKFPS